MKKNDHFLNYLLTIGFVFLVVVFLVLIVSVSRLVLSDSDDIRDYVRSTQNFLQELDDRERVLLNIDSFDFEGNFLITLGNPDGNFQIIDMSYMNANPERSIITFILNREINSRNNFLYIKLEDLPKLVRGDYILYDNESTAHFISQDNDRITLFDFETNQFIEINPNRINGQIFYIFKNE